MIKIISIKATILSVSLLYPLIGFVNDASAENSRCSLATLKGTYTFNAQGFNTISPVDTPTSYIGMVYFNGNGLGEIKWYFSGTNGAVIGTNTYVIESNCHATVTYNNGKIFDYFVAPDGDSVQWAINTPSTVRASAEAKRVSRTNLLSNN